jgi:tetratricopeptide (TPR) repeat protein
LKKLSTILLTIIISITLSACNNKAELGGISQEYKDAMSKGKSNVIEEEYDKAIDYFKLALESKKDDTEAKNLIEQLNLLVEAKDSEEHGAYFFQIEKIDKINDIKTETDVVKDKANEYKKTVLKNIDDSIDSFEEKINDGKYKSAQKDLEDTIEECKKSDSLKEQLDRCEELLKTCKEKKKEAEEQAKKQAEQKQQVASNSNSNGSSKKSSGEKDSNKVWCEWKRHYVDKENFIDETNRCQGCEVRRSLSSTFTYEDCPVCGKTCAVSRYSGKCQYCGEKIYPAVKKIYDDGTVILEDGSTW